MSRRNLHNDENFWPCVSDMFLALFVIALVLYSTMSAEKGKGDEYVSDLAAQEACSLFETLQREYPDSETIKGINVEEIRNEEHGARPKLAEALYGLLSCEETARYFYVTDDTLTKIPDSTEMYQYSDAIALLYESRWMGGSPPDKTDPCYHEHMRKVREHVEFEIYKSKSNSSFTTLSEEELLAKIKELKERINGMKTQEDYDKLNREYQELLKVGTNLDEWRTRVAALAAKKAQLERDLKNVNNANDKKKSEKGEKEEILQNLKLADTRKFVMKEVQKLLDGKYSALKDAGVEVDEEKGIVIIPSFVFSYPSVVITDYKKGKATITGELDKKLIGNLTSNQEKYLLQLAMFLAEIGQMVKNEKLQLPVDNIAIECYMKGEGNEGLILQCSFDVWRMLDKFSKQRLGEFKNADSQGLFSMTGFISEDGKVTPQLQLRFNCSPKRMAESTGQTK
ncbi:MAG: hypothetical protein E7031_01075 [Akkermansiaceae bacterium]|nr:hypothetical protein [Akkermansiaceae bacterium]